MFIRKLLSLFVIFVLFLSCASRSRLITVRTTQRYAGIGYYKTDLYSMAQLYSVVLGTLGNKVSDSVAFGILKDDFKADSLLSASTLEPRSLNIKLLVKKLNDAGCTIFTFKEISFSEIYASFNIPALAFVVSLDLTPKEFARINSDLDINHIDSSLFYYRDFFRVRLINKYRKFNEEKFYEIVTDDGILFTGKYFDSLKHLVAENSGTIVKPLFIFFVSSLPKCEISEYYKEWNKSSINSISTEPFFLKGYEKW